MSTAHFSLDPLQEQLAICQQSILALTLTRNVLIGHIIRRLREHEDIRFDEKMQWNEKCVELEILALERSQPGQKGKINEIKRSYDNPLDLIPCLRALTVVNQDGDPIFGKNVSLKSQQLKKHRNSTFHFSKDFNRENTFEWFGLIIDLLHVLGHEREEAQVRQLQEQLDIEGYRAYVKENQPVQEDISVASVSEVPKVQDAFDAYAAQIKTALSEQKQLEAVQSAIRGAKELISANRAQDALRLLQKVQSYVQICSVEIQSVFYDAQAMSYKAQGHSKGALGRWKKALALTGLPENFTVRLTNKMNQYQQELAGA